MYRDSDRHNRAIHAARHREYASFNPDGTRRDCNIYCQCDSPNLDYIFDCDSPICVKCNHQIKQQTKPTMTKENIIALTCKKHVKIYKLKQLGLTNKEIMEAVGSNAGHVYNVLKSYELKPELKTKSDLIL